MMSPVSPGEHRPLVSVLIRTLGRPTLGRAIESVRRQSLGDVEIVVSNSSGTPLPPLDGVRVVEPGRPLTASESANLLLANACGRFWTFLDDDDWLLPDHLHKLADTLQSDDLLVAAYSDVECVSGGQVVNVFARDFDLAALQLQNYLPIHSVMFRAGAAQGCGFAEELTFFEDWDFWLQLAARGPFRRVPGVSAVYAINPEAGSGHTSRQDLRREMLLRLGARQLARWQPADVAALVEASGAQVNARHALEQQNVALQQTLDARAAQLRELANNFRAVQTHSRQQQSELDKLAQVRRQLLDDIAVQQHQIELMRGSLSWRITRPLRGAKKAALAVVHSRPVRIVRNLSKAVLQDIGKHGLTGFARRVPYYLKNRDVYIRRLRSQAPGSDAAQFAAMAPQLREIRLHPDLDEPCATIDAKVSVVIPTLNAGAEFDWLLRKLKGQQGVREIEIVIVDSGSKDQTVPLARAAGAKVVEILPSEFSHSYARNLGARNASGDYLLFMVQDAYPIGDRWLQGLLAFLQEHAETEKLAAVSCAEYARSDSEMMYDAMIDTHYKFLGCLEHDRLGEWRGDDHMALRSQGQLSDVSCLIPRELFAKYEYRGDYAEDLDLGIRLIKDGMRVAMLASVKTVHSHNRPAYYYLKRTFVDVIFLVGLFDDFTYPRCESLEGLLAGIRAAGAHVSGWLAQPSGEGGRLGEQLARWIEDARRELEQPKLEAPVALADAKLDEFVNRLGVQAAASGSTALQEARRFTDMFLGRLEHFNAFAREVYGELDATLRGEAADVIRKTYAATAGAALAFYCLDHKDAQAEAIRKELVAGV